ncbi:MAG: glycosyltransferase family 4 protein [Vicinamibacteria bacterium]|nr:glycosyltransferase family 4 protein [Vicinamibacteria bacterium]
MRLAFVSPLPPAPSGIADYTMDVARALQGPHRIDLFHDQAEVSESLGLPSFPIAELPARAGAEPYDAVVYQMGNAPVHDFMYAWMERVSGLVVLHDLVLHHSFARRFLESPEARAYARDPANREKQVEAEKAHRSFEAAIEAVYPGQAARLRDAHFNTTGDLLPYVFPLFEPALVRARGVGAHNAFMVQAIQAARPDLTCVQLAMPVRPMAVRAGESAALRARFGLRDGEPVVGCFGLVTREKRIETVARAVARVSELHPNVRLLLAGQVSDPSWLESLLDRTSVSKRTIVAGRIEAGAFAAAMGLADAVVHLRYPTARETSAALLRVMAQGRPAIISDIANQSEIPDDVARRVDPIDEEGDLARAIEWALSNPEAASKMGERARRFVETAHSEARTRESYEALLKPLADHYSPVSP